MSRSNGSRRPRARTIGGVACLLVAGLVVGSLAVPSPAGAAPPPHDYRIVEGDTLSEVAEALGTSTDALAAANGIADPDHVVAGRTLTVPAPAAPAPASSGGGSSPVPASRRYLGPVFDRWSARNGIPASLLKALCFMESGWQADVVSSTGADGVCQMMPDTEDHMEALIGHELDSSDAEDNIRLGARYLRWLLARTDGDARTAVGAYYQGLSAMRRHGPYDETVTYVDAVLALRERFR